MWVALDLAVMLARTAKVLASLSFIELVVFVIAGSMFGLFRSALAVVALSAIGIWYLLNRTPSVVRSGLADLSEGNVNNEYRGVGDNAMKVAGGLLLAYPGLITGFVGGLLFIGPVRSALRPMVVKWLSKLVPAEVSESFGGFAGAFRRRDVVDVTYRTKDSSQDNASDSTHPELPGRSV